MWNQNIGPWQQRNSKHFIPYDTSLFDMENYNQLPSNQISNIYSIYNQNRPQRQYVRELYSKDHEPIHYSQDYNSRLNRSLIEPFDMSALRNNLTATYALPKRESDGYLSSHIGHDISEQQSQDKIRSSYSNEISERFTGHLERPMVTTPSSYDVPINFTPVLDQSSHMNLQRMQYITPSNDNATNNEVEQYPSVWQYPIGANNSSTNFILKPIIGDGNCFFTAVADEFLRLLNSNECNIDEIRRYFSEDNGYLNNRRVMADRIRKLCVQEWLNNENYYGSFLVDTVNFVDECERFGKHGYYRSPLGDLAPLTVANIFNVCLLIISKNLSRADLKVQPSLPNPNESRLEKELCTINLYHNPTDEGHYDVALAKLPTMKNIPVHKV